MSRYVARVVIRAQSSRGVPNRPRGLPFYAAAVLASAMAIAVAGCAPSHIPPAPDDGTAFDNIVSRPMAKGEL